MYQNLTFVDSGLVHEMISLKAGWFQLTLMTHLVPGSDFVHHLVLIRGLNSGSLSQKVELKKTWMKGETFARSGSPAAFYIGTLDSMTDGTVQKRTKYLAYLINTVSKNVFIFPFWF